MTENLTDAEYQELRNKAYAMGLEYARGHIAGGMLEPLESPLSGEWAGDVSPAEIYRALETEPEDDASLLADWTDGYMGAAWPTEAWSWLPSTQEEG